MAALFTQRGYPCTSLEHDLRRVTAISRPDALRGSEQADTTTDRVPLVLTYHPFNTQVKQYLIQNFNILSTDQQTRDIFPQQPFLAYRRDLSLENMLVHSAENSSTGRPGSRACQRPRCQTCEYINPVTEIRGPKCTFTMIISPACQKISCTVYPAADVPISTSVKLGEASEVDLENICE